MDGEFFLKLSWGAVEAIQMQIKWFPLIAITSVALTSVTLTTWFLKI